MSADKQTRRRSFGAAAIGLAAAALSLGLWLSGALDRAENVSWDLRVRQAAEPSAASDQIAIILIDQASLDWGAEINALPWPWPRELYGALIGFCRRAGARAVTFDMIFSEPSFFGVSDDEALALAMSAAPDVVGSCHVDNDGELSWPVPELRDAPARLGNVAGHPDPDGVMRRTPLAFASGDTVIDGLSLATYNLAESASVARPQETRILRYAPAGTYPAYSAAAVVQSEIQLMEGLEPNLDPAVLRGRHVFVGTSAPGLLDLRATPLSRVTPGVVVHATAFDNLMTDGFVTASPLVLVMALTAVLAMLAAVLALRTSRLVLQVVLFAVALPLPSLLGLGLYTVGQWWPVVPMTMALLLALVGGLGLNWATEGRQRRFLKNAFRHYLSPHVVERLVDDPSRLKLGGERRELSIFFSDLAGFTGLSENLDPETLTELLNTYLSAMTDIILDEGGTLDKYEGDAIIAFWNAPLDQPDHALRAARAAVRCQQELAARTAEWRHIAGRDLSMRIGIHTGAVVVGNLGSSQRFDYTVLGDAANLASRLEGANKAFGTGIMVSEAVMDGGANELPHRELGRVQVVGRDEPVSVFELSTETDGGLPATWPTYREVLELARMGRTAEAHRMADPHLADDPAMASLAGRLRAEDDFRGLWRLDSK